MSDPQPWHFTTLLDLVDQTLFTGVFAVVAAVGTIWVTRHIANRQIAASREEADKVIAATRAARDSAAASASPSPLWSRY
jgi:hypothetical protein